MEKIGKKITLENVSHDEQETHLDSIEAIKGNIRERNTEEQLQQDQKELHFEIEHGKHLAEQRKRELAEKIKEEIDFLAKENPIIEEGLLAGKEDHEITWEKKESEKTGFWNKIWNKFKKPTTTTLGALTVASGAAGATGVVHHGAERCPHRQPATRRSEPRPGRTHAGAGKRRPCPGRPQLQSEFPQTAR